MQNIHLPGTATSSTEKIFNLFLYEERGIIREYGAVFHKISGDEGHKFGYLRSKAKADALSARRFPVPAHLVLLDPSNGTKLLGAITNDMFRFLASGQRHLQVFEEAFVALKAPRAPLFLITFVIDGDAKA